LNRRKLVFLTAFMFLLVLSAVLSAKMVAQQTAFTMGLISSETPVVIIDPGHGGMDGGATSQSGSVIEKDINLSISLKLRDFFLLNGFQVLMTRDTDKSIHDSTAVTLKQQKTSDIKNRLKMLNNTPNSVFLSIHQNFFEQSKYWGAQIFYSPNTEESAALADFLQASFITRLQPESKRQIKEAGSSLYILKNAKKPAVLVECGFLSNPDEAEKLSTEEYQNQIAFTIFSGYMEYLQSVVYSPNEGNQ